MRCNQTCAMKKKTKKKRAIKEKQWKERGLKKYTAQPFNIIFAPDTTRKILPFDFLSLKRFAQKDLFTSNIFIRQFPFENALLVKNSRHNTKEWEVVILRMKVGCWGDAGLRNLLQLLNSNLSSSCLRLIVAITKATNQLLRVWERERERENHLAETHAFRKEIIYLTNYNVYLSKLLFSILRNMQSYYFLLECWKFFHFSFLNKITNFCFCLLLIFVFIHC